MLHLFLLGWKLRFLGSFSSQPTQQYHEGQRENRHLHSREAKDEALEMSSASELRKCLLPSKHPPVSKKKPFCIN